MNCKSLFPRVLYSHCLTQHCFIFLRLGRAHSIPEKKQNHFSRQFFNFNLLHSSFLLLTSPDHHIHFGKIAAYLVGLNQVPRVHGHATFDSNSCGVPALSRRRCISQSCNAETETLALPLCSACAVTRVDLRLGHLGTLS